MINNTVNRTALHPGGVLPSREHTEIEEELYETANIDYERVAIISNPSVAALYEDALVYEEGTAITSSGALSAYSGAKTGRSPLDKRIVKEAGSSDDIWWGPVNKPMTPDVWLINRERAIDYLNTRNRIYVIDGFAGWDEQYRINVRVVCARAYHALFMRNMLIRPTKEQLLHFHPDYVIYNAGSFPANRYTSGMTSATSVSINFADKEMVILGTEYAGEMKKGIFTVLFYEMPVKHNILTLHSSANEGKGGDVTVFFGLSGTGKTTLSADPNRALIGDDEHCWSDRGVFNIEGGCYAKCVGLSGEKEPDIYNAIKFGSVLENVVFDPDTRTVDYDDCTLTENTRCAYPIEYISNAKIPCISMNHPTNIILLTCDARGVLPPISKLDSAQTMFHFISGYTSKMAGTEDGVTEPQATFSSCFAQPFLALHPMRYAKMLADKIEHHKANAWLLNTGWVGAGATTGGKRCPLKYTRAILDSIHSGELAKAEYETYGIFNLNIPKSVTGVPSELLNPKTSWAAGNENFTAEVTKLGKLFNENFKKYSDEATPDVIKAGPQFEPDFAENLNENSAVDQTNDLTPTPKESPQPEVVLPQEITQTAESNPNGFESHEDTKAASLEQPQYEFEQPHQSIELPVKENNMDWHNLTISDFAPIEPQLEHYDSQKLRLTAPLNGDPTHETNDSTTITNNGNVEPLPLPLPPTIPHLPILETSTKHQAEPNYTHQQTPYTGSQRETIRSGAATPRLAPAESNLPPAEVSSEQSAIPRPFPSSAPEVGMVAPKEVI
ncbi:MAG: Protein kinase C-like 1 [Trizodia sp. TS-e1964]|nr:MAG: Protein kinase C-like 1 [Trizodia sp. TS-e1964]